VSTSRSSLSGRFAHVDLPAQVLFRGPNPAGRSGRLNPFNYVIFPFAALAGTAVGKRVDERALNLDLYENVEESTVDLYSAVRNGYLQQRQKMIDDLRLEIR